MSISISISMSDFERIMTGLEEKLSGNDMIRLNNYIGDEVSIFVADWYRRAGNDHFDNPSSPTHGPGRRETNWARSITENWGHKNVSPEGVTVFLDSDEGIRSQYRMKVYGGLIQAKKAKALTIPVHPTAHAVRASEYTNITGNNLFKPAGKSYLATLINGEFTPVYILRKSVQMNPHPNPRPTEEEIEDATIEALENAIEDMFD